MNNFTPSIATDSKFQTFYALTETLCQQPHGSLQYSHGSKKRWSDLASVWYSHDIGCDDVFYTVLYRIHRGVYPLDTYSPALLSLLSLVEEEILADDYTYRAWSTMERFKAALKRILSPFSDPGAPTDPGYHSIMFCTYLRDRTINAVVHKGSHTDAQANCQRYEYVTKRLIPASAEWTDQQWCNDIFALEAIKTLYGIDYIGKSDDLSRTYRLLYKIWHDNTIPTTKELMGIENMSLALASLIWPAGTIDHAIETYLAAYEKRIATPRSTRTRFSCEELRKSGIFNLLFDLFQNDALSSLNRKGIQRPLYEIGIGI